MVESPSGRWRTPRKRVRVQALRGFKSHLHRSVRCLGDVCGDVCNDVCGHRRPASRPAIRSAADQGRPNNLASVVSKHIGETEQNLEKVFAAVSAGSSVLFFDEADSLFGKRSEVRDSRDRYANLEVSYLLQRLEDYDGVVVLATNMPKNSTTRSCVASIPSSISPYPAWRTQGDRAELDFDLLAERCEVSGEIIRNAAVSTAFHAADDGQPVTMTHVMAALVSEYTKLGRLIKEGDFDAGQTRLAVHVGPTRISRSSEPPSPSPATTADRCENTVGAANRRQADRLSTPTGGRDCATWPSGRSAGRHNSWPRFAQPEPPVADR